MNKSVQASFRGAQAARRSERLGGHPLCMPLPAVVQEAQQAGVEATRVLVVDDDPAIRRLVIATLKRDGYEFFEAANGREALDRMRSDHPNCVVLDLMMPIVSGWDVLQERVRDPELTKIPVIIVSANREPELVRALDKGVCAFLPKPFDIAALSALVRACVTQS